jgi:hypothetical protein
MTKLEFSKHTNIYFWNLEQKSLESWDTVLYPVHQYLTGNKRQNCGPWMELIKTNIDMFHYNNYISWVDNGGGFDEWLIYESQLPYKAV